jgi:hypothetical protein
MDMALTRVDSSAMGSVPGDLGSLRVFVTSWNMGNAEQHGLQHVFTEKSASDNFDLIVLGLQESTYTSIKGSTSVDCFSHLANQIAEILGPLFYKVRTDFY